MRASSGPERGGRALRHGGARALLVLASLLLAPPLYAQAIEEDGVRWSATVGLVRDDNVFRLADGVDPQPLLGADDTADTYSRASLGLHWGTPLAAQRIEGRAALTDYRFERYGRLDHDGYSAAAGWLWRAGTRFGGRLGFAADRSLASLANLQSGIQSSTPNFLKTRELTLDGGYGQSTHWQLRGAVGHLEQRNSAADFQPSDMRRDRFELVLGYVSGAGNRIGLMARRDDARLPNPQLIASVPVDNSYRQRRIGALLDWVPTGKSRFNLWGGRVARDYRQLPQRDHAAWAYHAAWEWRPTGKLQLTVATQRDLGENEQVNVGFVTIRGIAVQPAMQLGGKTRLTLNFQRDQRRYGGDLALDAGGTTAPLRERVRILGLDLSCQATRVFNVALGLRREVRDSNRALADYRTGIASLEVRAVL